LRAVHHSDVTTRSPDERVYIDYAQRIAEGGLDVMPQAFQDYDSDSANWLYPGPTRFGHVLLFAIAMEISGVHDARAAAFVSLLFGIFSLFLVARIGVRFFDPWIAAGAVTFMAFSVGELGMTRRACQDVVFGFFCLVLIWLTCEITRDPRRFSLYPLFLGMGSYTLITKETAWLCYGLCGLWVFGVWLWKERSPKGAALMALGGAVSIGLAFAVLAALAGDASLALSTIYHATHSSASLGGQWYCSGPWYQFFYLLWLVGPLTELLAAVGLVAMAVSFDRRSWKLQAERWPIGILTLVFLCFAAFYPNLQYLRIISPVDGCYCLLAATGLSWLFSLLKRFLPAVDSRVFALVLLVAVALEGVWDYHVFTSVVVRSGMQDLAVSFIRGAMGR